MFHRDESSSPGSPGHFTIGYERSIESGGAYTGHCVVCWLLSVGAGTDLGPSVLRVRFDGEKRVGAWCDHKNEQRQGRLGPFHRERILSGTHPT